MSLGFLEPLRPAFFATFRFAFLERFALLKRFALLERFAFFFVLRLTALAPLLLELRAALSFLRARMMAFVRFNMSRMTLILLLAGLPEE